MQRSTRYARRSPAVLGGLVSLVIGILLAVPTHTATAVVGERVTVANPDPIQWGTARGSKFVSTITVAGQPTVLEDVNVSLFGFRAPVTFDVDVVLESPQGTRIVVMSDPIGSGNTCSADGRTFDLTFDDQAGGPMGGGWRSGRFQPYDYSACDDGDSFVPSTSYSTLSRFNGEDPNGVWKLHLADDASTPWGEGPNELTGGWSLDLGYPAPPIAAGDLQVAGPENSAFHNHRTCSVINDGGTIVYPVKVINTGDEASQYRLATRAPARLFRDRFTTTPLPQNQYGYLTPVLAPGAVATYFAKIKLPAGPGITPSVLVPATLHDTNGTVLDGIGICASEAAGASSPTSELLVKSGNQLPFAGAQGIGATGKTLIPGGAVATFTATVKNRQAATRRMSFTVQGAGWAESPDCDNISVTIKTGGADITALALERDYLTPPMIRGQSRTFAITIKATGPKTSDWRTCDTDYWYIETNDSEGFIDVNLAAPAK